MLLIIINSYRLLISPLIGYPCRYTPSCSAYAKDAIKIHGPWYGSYLSGKRLCRCHPWGSNGYDPVPEIKQNRKKL